MKPLIFLELNEINFDFLRAYIKEGYLPNFRDLIETNGFYKTHSEKNYHELEPWIQWVTAHTGKEYSQHNVYRLGDIVQSDVEQVWEKLEQRGHSVAAVSPINGDNRTKKSPFWIPDPWVDTNVSGDNFTKRIYRAIKQAVNDNTEERLTFSTKLTIIQALLTRTKISSWTTYAKLLLGALKKQHWSKAMLLDRLLADIFYREWENSRPDFATLFLNGAAHIQHHYFFNSRVYSGDQKNPHWYISSYKDPIYEVYSLYDSILGDALLRGCRIMVGTGLQQIPYERTTFYYRLKDHSEFLNRLRISYKRVLPRMSRDFLIEFDDQEECNEMHNCLIGIYNDDGEKIFEVDNREESLFVTLIYPHEIKKGVKLYNREKNIITHDFSQDVSFVAIKNGHHEETGYFIDTDDNVEIDSPPEVPLKDVHQKVMTHFDEAN